MAPAERSGPSDEKVTVNIGPVDLGRIDLLVREGVYASRTDFIRNAIRAGIESHAKLVDEVATRKEYVFGYLLHNAKDFERFREKGDRLRVRVVGMYQLAADVTPELASQVLEEVSVLGTLRGPDEVIEWIEANVKVKR